MAVSADSGDMTRNIQPTVTRSSRTRGVSRADYDRRSVQQRLFTCAIEANVPVYLTGKPGIGKTEFISAFARRNGYEAILLSAPHLEPGDITGLPVESPSTDGKFRTTFAMMEWIDILNNAPKAILFIDELPLASDDTRKTLLSLIQGHTAGIHKLGDHVRIVAAGNPMSWSMESVPLSEAMRTRLLHISWKSDRAEWLEHHLTKYVHWTAPALPTDGDVMGEDACHQLDGILYDSPSLIDCDDITNLDPESPFNVNRSWDNVFDIIRVIPSNDFEVLHYAMTGLVGEEPAAKVSAAMRYRLPVREVIKDPYVFDWNGEPGDRVYALLAAVVDHAVDSTSKLATPDDASYVLGVAAKSRADIAYAHLSRMLSWLPDYELDTETAKIFADFIS